MYIDSSQKALKMYVNKGIDLNTLCDCHGGYEGTCAVGYSPRYKKWYGWSHRAVAGFRIGHDVRADTILAKHFPVGWVADTDEKCKQLALKFAEEVS